MFDTTPPAISSPLLHKDNNNNPLANFLKKFDSKKALDKNSSKTLLDRDSFNSDTMRDFVDDDDCSMPVSLMEGMSSPAHSPHPERNAMGGMSPLSEKKGDGNNKKNNNNNPIANFFKKFDKSENNNKQSMRSLPTNLPEKLKNSEEDSSDDDSSSKGDDDYNYDMPKSMMAGAGRSRSPQLTPPPAFDDRSVASNKSAPLPLEVGFPKGRRKSRNNSPVPHIFKSMLSGGCDDLSVVTTQSTTKGDASITVASNKSSDSLAATFANNTTVSPSYPDDMESQLTATRFQLAAVQAELDKALTKLDRAETERDWLRNKYSELQFEQSLKDEHSERMGLDPKESYYPRQASTTFDPVSLTYRERDNNQ